MRGRIGPHVTARRDRIGRERSRAPSTIAELHEETDHGALLVGSPKTVAQKIAVTVRTLGPGRFDLTDSNGAMPHEQPMGCIELYGTEVVPRVRQLLASWPAMAQRAEPFL